MSDKLTVEEVKSILKYIGKGYKVPKVIYNVVKEVARREIEEKEKVVLLKRNPNIERSRIQGNFVKIIEGECIDICPTSVGNYGCDFDGDCLDSTVVYYHNNTYTYTHIKNMGYRIKMELESEKTKDDGVHVKIYKLLEDVFIPAISQETGDVEYKKVTHWSTHENLNMYSFARRPRNGCIDSIKDTWISNDHSCIVYNKEGMYLERKTPSEIKEEPEKYFMIKKKSKPQEIEEHPFQKYLHSADTSKIASEKDLGLLFGMYLGDGYISYSGSNKSSLNLFALTGSDEEMHSKWSAIVRCLNISDNVVEFKDVSSKYEYSRYYKKDGSETAMSRRSYIINSNFSENINEIFGRGCAEKHLPSYMLHFTKDFYIGLIAGYFLTDGTTTNQYLSFYSKSEDLIKDLSFVLKYKFNIDNSIYKETKKSTIDKDGVSSISENEEDWRDYWILQIRVKECNVDFFKEVLDKLHGKKYEKLEKIINKVKTIKSVDRCTYVPHILIENISREDRKKKLGITDDHRYKIKNTEFCGKEIKLPENIYLENNNLSTTAKNLIKLNQEDEIDIIPCEYLDIEYDPEVTTGYDLTVEDYYTFCTAEGLFVYDSMSVYAPMSNEAQDEVKKKIMKVEGSSTINQPTYELGKETLTGLFTQTHKDNKNKPVDIGKDPEKAKELDPGDRVSYIYDGKRIETTAGRVVFNSLLPKGYIFINEEITKKKVESILSDILSKSHRAFVETVHKLMKDGFDRSTEYPRTISLETLRIPDNIMKLKRQLEKEKDFNKQYDILTQMETDLLEHLKNNVPQLYDHVKSGASKGVSQLRQVMIAKGLVTDTEGNILPVVTKAMHDGYSGKEFFDASAAARLGTLTRSLHTSKGGYAYRKVFYAIGSAEANINRGDCETKLTLDIKLTNELYKRMPGRYVLNQKGDVIPINSDMIGEFIKLRSPIFCKSPGICRTCYGELIKQIGTKNIGILASMEVTSLSERIMKTFHTGGAIALTQIDSTELLRNFISEKNYNQLLNSVKQDDERNLISLIDDVRIDIPKNVYDGKYKYEFTREFLKLPLGYFRLVLGNLEINCAMEYPLNIYIPEEKTETEEIITYYYNKNDKIFQIENVSVDASQVADELDALLSGKSPWTDPRSLYLKLFTKLSPTGGWDSVHLETILSTILRNKNDLQSPARLKQPYDATTVSIKQLPGIISWPLGLAFENFSRSVTYGMLEERAPESDLERVMFGENLTDE